MHYHSFLPGNEVSGGSANNQGRTVAGGRGRVRIGLIPR